MAVGLYPGTFDPVTNGHLDIIERAARVFEKVIVGVAKNSAKNPLFTDEERVSLLQQSLSHIENIEVKMIAGLTVEAAKQHGANVLIRGLRTVSDYEDELRLNGINRHLEPSVETFFIMADSRYNFLSSTIVKEAASYHSDISELVPAPVLQSIKSKFLNHTSD